MDESPRSGFDWMRRHRRGIAASVLGFWLLPALVFSGIGMWVLGRDHPAWLAVVALLVVLALVGARRKLTADRR